MLEVAVAGEEMAMVVLREVVVMVPAHPQTQTQTHSLSHPSDVPRRNHRRLMAAAVVWWASAVEEVVVVPWDDHSHDASSFGPPQSTPVPVGWWPRPPARCC